MRVAGSSKSVGWRETNSGRNCRPDDTCAWVTTSRSGTISSSKSVVRDDVRKSASSSGWRPPLPYAMEASDGGVCEGSITWQGLYGYGPNAAGGSRLTRDGAMYRISVNSDFTPVSSNESARLKARALSRLKSQQIDLAMALASRRSTAELLASSAARLAKAYRLARQRNFAGAAKELGIRNSVRPGTKSASSGWLQLQFGWAPLMSDIYGAYNELTMNHPTDGEMVVVRASDRQASTTEDVFNYSPWGSGYVSAKVKRRLIATRDVKVSYWYKLNSQALHAAARNGLTDPAVVVWDVIPFSFVVDWLLPVGQYLRNLTADVGFTYLGGSQTYFERREVSDRSVGVITPVHNSYRNVTGTASIRGSAKGVKMQRTVVPSPGSEIYLKNPFSTFTIVTSVSLMFQAFQSDAPWRKIRL